MPSLYGVYILPQETLGYVVQVKRLYSQELQIPTEQSLKVEKWYHARLHSQWSHFAKLSLPHKAFYIPLQKNYYQNHTGKIIIADNSPQKW